MQIFKSKTVNIRKLIKFPVVNNIPAKFELLNENSSSKKYNVKKQIFISIYHKRLLILAPFLMLLGIIIYKNLAQEPNFWLFLVLGISVGLFIIFQRKNAKESSFAMLILSFIIGFSLLPIHAKMFGTKLLQYPVYGSFTAEVIDVISRKSDGQRVVISNIVRNDSERLISFKKARLFIRNSPLLEIGNVINGKIRFSEVPSPIVPGGYDSQFHSFFDGIGAYGTLLSEPEIIETANNIRFRGLIHNIRTNIGMRITDALSQPSNSVALALIVGNQTKITSETRDAMAKSGLAHMLAISGLHLTLVAGGVYSLFRLLFSFIFVQHFPVKKLSAIIGIFAALFYLSISGASVSAIRATIMLLLIFGAIIAGRRALTMRNVAFAAIIIIAIDPSSVFRASFQLSFAAVVALVGVYELINKSAKSTKRRTGFGVGFFRFFAGLSATSLIAGLATAIFAAYHFQQSAPLGVIGNLLALPILTFIVLPSGFIALILMPFGLEGVFLSAMGWGIELILNIAFLVTNWSTQLDYTPLLKTNSLIFATLALACLAFFITKLRLFGVIILIPILAIFSIDRSPDILIANSTKAIAIRGYAIDGGRQFSLALISGRLNSFATNAWQGNYQEQIYKKLDGALCDEAACFYNSPLGFSVSLIKNGRSAFIEDCAIADLIITRVKAPKFCRDLTQVIDIKDLNRGGMQWLAWDEKKEIFNIIPAVKNPNRPWRIGYKMEN